MRDRSLWTFVACTILLCIPAVIGISSCDHLSLHMGINRFHAPWADRFFSVWTNLASGWAPSCLALALLAWSWRAFLMMGISVGGSAILAQALKHLCFSGVDRPAMFLYRMPALHLVPGVELHQYFSFPSGHATSAFSMCLALAIVSGRRWSAVVLAIIAASLAFSRVYLSQHFTEDVLAGAVLGAAVGMGTYYLLYFGRWGRSDKLDRSPFRR